MCRRLRTALGLQYYVTGFDWLVYNGIAVADQFNNTTGADKAPRTAIGVDGEGKLMLLVVDGCQRWYVLCVLCDALVRVN